MAGATQEYLPSQEAELRLIDEQNQINEGNNLLCVYVTLDRSTHNKFVFNFNGSFLRYSGGRK